MRGPCMLCISSIESCWIHQWGWEVNPEESWELATASLHFTPASLTIIPGSDDWHRKVSLLTLLTSGTLTYPSEIWLWQFYKPYLSLDLDWRGQHLTSRKSKENHLRKTQWKATVKAKFKFRRALERLYTEPAVTQIHVPFCWLWYRFITYTKKRLIAWLLFLFSLLSSNVAAQHKLSIGHYWISSALLKS